ncbi:transposase [Streptomyces olivochromogenes]|nr:transposase [Streptomyces olivochromogenes]
MTREQLTDGEWEFIEPYPPIGAYGPHPVRLRQQFEDVIWRFRTGARWREMPTEFGVWPTIQTASGSGGTPASSRPCWRA